MYIAFCVNTDGVSHHLMTQYDLNTRLVRTY